MKQKESEENRVIERALFLYVESGGPNIDVNFLWAPHYKIRKRDRNDLARRLASLVRQNIPQLGSAVRLDWRNFESDLMAAISDISINRLIDFNRSHWQAARAGWVANWDTATLQKEIDKNDSKPAKLRDSIRRRGF